MPATRDLTLLLRAQDQMSMALREVAGAARSLQGATGGLEKETAKATHTMQGFGNVMLSPANMLKMSVGFMAMGAGISGIQSAMDATKYAMFGFNSTLEQSSVAFTVMTGSADIAQQHLEELQAFARQTPFDFPELLEASRRLQAYGVNVQDIIPTLTILGNITAGVGREKLPQLILAFGQVQAATKLTGMELRQFSETGVPLLGALATQMGKTTGEIQEMISAGKISFRDVRKALESMAGEGGRFGDMMQKQSRTFEGAMSNIRDAASQIGAKAFEDLYNSARDMTVGIADKLTDLNVAMHDNEVAWDAWSTAVTIAMAVTGGAVVGRIVQMVGGLGSLGTAAWAARAAVGAAMIGPGGIGAIIMGISTIVFGGLAKLRDIGFMENAERVKEWRGMMHAELEALRATMEEEGATWAESFVKPAEGIEDLTGNIRKMKEEMHEMGTVGEHFVDPQTTADLIATADYIANIQAEAEKLAKSGDLEGAAKLLESIGTDIAKAANQVVAWGNETEKSGSRIKTVLEETEKDSSQVKTALEEIIPVMEQLNRKNAFKVWREDMKALLAEGDLEGVIAGFEAIGWTAKATAQEILKMTEENQDAMEALTKKGQEQIEDYFETQERARHKAADAVIAETERIIRGTAEAIRDSLGKGGTVQQGLDAFAKAEWIKSMAADIEKVSKQIRESLAAGLDPSDIIKRAQPLFAAYTEAVKGVATATAQAVSAISGAVITSSTQLFDEFKALTEHENREQLERQKEYITQYGREQEAIFGSIFGVERLSLAGFNAASAIRASQSNRQAFSEMLDELSKEAGWLEVGGRPTEQSARLRRAFDFLEQRGPTADIIKLIGRLGGSPGADTIATALGFAHGGIVPGPIGTPMLATVHGGETITPSGSRGTVSITVDMRGAIISSRADAEQWVAEAWQQVFRRGGFSYLVTK